MQLCSYDMGKEAADYAEDGEFERPDELAEFLEMLRGKLWTR